MFVCNYYSDLGQIHYGLKAVLRQSEAFGKFNYTLEEIIPKSIKAEIKTASSSCPLGRMTPRLLTIFDDLGAEWQFTIPFTPYTEKWANFLEEIKTPKIKAYKIRGEIVKYSRVRLIV